MQLPDIVNPPDKTMLRWSGGGMVYDSHCVRRPSADLFDPQHGNTTAQAVTHGGRQAAWFTQGDFGQAVLRHYRRGGLVARLVKDNYLWLGEGRTRSLAEFLVLQHLLRRCVAVPRPLAAAWWRSGLVYRAAILIQRIADAQTLAQLATTSDARPRVAHQVALAICAMHDAGVWHADLNAHNVLIAPGQAWLIDFDKARIVTVTSRQRRANLARLHRSLMKVAPDRGDVWWKDISQAYALLQSGENRRPR